MGSPARRLTNPITRCRDQPHYRYAGTDDGRGTDQTLDTNRLTLMSGRSLLGDHFQLSQPLIALEIEARVREVGLIARELPFRLRELRLEGAGIDLG